MRVSGFEKILYFTKFNLEKKCNSHSSCIFCCAIAIEEEKIFLDHAGKEVQIFWDEEDKSICIFNGRIENVKVNKSLHSADIEVFARSFSVIEDESIYTRIWQNPSKKFGDVLSKSRLELKNCDLRLSNNLIAIQYSNPILQNQESNFSFIRRIAEYVKIPLWIDDTKSGRGVFILSESLSDTVYNVNDDEILRYSAAKDQSGKNSITLTLKKYLPFGSKLKLSQESGEYVIHSLTIHFQHETYEFCYELESYSSWKYEVESIPHIEKTVYLKGIVTENKDPKNLGRIQVSFKESNAQDMDQEKFWIPYQTPYTGLSGGIVFIPDVGDKVNVVFSNENLYATSAIRENPLADECKKIIEKYIGNNSKRRIFFREKELKLASGENLILIDDEKIEIVIGESKMILTKDQVRLIQNKTELILDSKGAYIKTNDNEVAINNQGIIGKSKKQIDLDSQGSINIVGKNEVVVETKSKLSLNGSVVNIG